MYDKLFQPVKIGNLELKNRFVRSATHEASSNSPDRVNDKLLKIYNDLSKGGVGLIITGSLQITTSEFENSNPLLCDDVNTINALHNMTKMIHDNGSKIAVQLFHMGKEEADILKLKEKTAIAPSVIYKDTYYSLHSMNYREITEDEIREIIVSFGKAALRAKEVGFDAVQIHGAHAYLFSQFLSPYANRRNDKWGGCLKNRLRLHTETYKEIRKQVGDNYPVFIKIGVADAFPEGLKFEEGKIACMHLAELGMDALEISQGLRTKYIDKNKYDYTGTEWRDKIKSVKDEGYFGAWAKDIKRSVNVPVIDVGGYRTPQLMLDVIEKGYADLIGLCRPLICEPCIINEWQKGRASKSICTSCNLKCLNNVIKGSPMSCIFHNT